jgi:hypothetical protein
MLSDAELITLKSCVKCVSEIMCPPQLSHPYCSAIDSKVCHYNRNFVRGLFEVSHATWKLLQKTLMNLWNTFVINSFCYKYSFISR